MEVETTNNHNGQEATESLEVKAEEMKVEEAKAEPVNEEAQPKMEEANVVQEEAKEQAPIKEEVKEEVQQQHVVVEKEEVKPEDLLSEEEEKELKRRFPLVTYKNGGTNVPLVTKYKIKWEGRVSTSVSSMSNTLVSHPQYLGNFRRASPMDGLQEGRKLHEASPSMIFFSLSVRLMCHLLMNNSNTKNGAREPRLRRLSPLTSKEKCKGTHKPLGAS